MVEERTCRNFGSTNIIRAPLKTLKKGAKGKEGIERKTNPI